MKANELRIGNVLKDKYTGDLLVVSELTKERITFDYQTNEKWQSEPIKITEEILLKCGFEGNGFVFTHLKLGSVYLKKYYREADYFLVKSNGGDGLTSLKHLHQLQNLYFALTGEELEINL